MKIVIFDVKSSLGHFRRPDTTATHLTYPFIPPTVVKGMVGAILGIEDFTTKDKVGIEIKSEVKLASQQLSLLGKGKTFNRPTTIQLVVEPSYRIYYTGEEYTDDLEGKLRNKQSVYPTYLGSAFALTTPVYIDSVEVEEISTNQMRKSRTIVPVSCIDELGLDDDYYFQRASGFMKEYLGERTFARSIDFIYEQKGKKIKFKANNDEDVLIAKMGEDDICLV